MVAETLEISPPVARAVTAGAAAEELQRLAVANGMTTMVADAVRRAAADVTSIDEVLRVFSLR